jgi:dolichyl-phosphate-mannose-protein mannosyltransferase
MTRRAAVACALLAAAFVLRVAALDRVRVPTGDEAMHVPNAFAYAEGGHLGPDNWHHPPLKHLMTYAAIRLFGDDPYGWRLRNVVFGAGSVAVVFLLGEALFGAGMAGLVAALLLLLDPLHLALSRSTFEDVPAVFFVLLGSWLAVRHFRSGSAGALAGAGVAFGLAVALRTFFAPVVLAAGIVLAGVEVRRGRPARVLGIVACFVVVPAIVYLVAFFPWFRRGYSFGEWLVEQRWALTEAAAARNFDAASMKLDRPWRWFVLPAGIAVPLPGDGVTTRRIFVLMNDLPLWGLVLPAVAATAWYSLRERAWELAALAVAFVLLYVPFLVAPRPILLYSAIAVLPFGFLAIGHLAARLLGRWAPAFAVLAVSWGLWLYPLATASPVSPERYEPVLRYLERPPERS